MTSNEVQKQQYFEFLCGIIGDIRRGVVSEYTLLLEHLHKKEFYSLVPNDDNRGEDGKKLRMIFEEEANQGLSFFLEEPCTVLEMLIGLSFRIENNLKDGPHDMSTGECFWMLINNLGLSWANNNAYCQDYESEAIDEQIDIFLSRNYGKNGDGGLFPLKKPLKDQRKVEIWYQMAEYLLENFDF